MSNEIIQNAILGTTNLYIDPSAVSIVVTSISAIVIAVGATAIIIWRRAKNKVAAKLNIDSNKNKEVEDDIVINDKESESK